MQQKHNDVQETKLGLGRERFSDPESHRLYSFDEGTVKVVFAAGRLPTGVGPQLDGATTVGEPAVAKDSRSLRAAHPHVLGTGAAVVRGCHRCGTPVVLW